MLVQKNCRLVISDGETMLIVNYFRDSGLADGAGTTNFEKRRLADCNGESTFCACIISCAACFRKSYLAQNADQMHLRMVDYVGKVVWPLERLKYVFGLIP